MEKQYQSVIDRLTDSYIELTPQLQLAARFIIDHPDEVGLNSLRQVAKQSQVTPATVSRLVKAIGYDSYQEFRSPFRQELRKKQDLPYANKLRDIQKKKHGKAFEVFAEIREQENLNLKASLSDAAFPDLLTASEIILASKNVYILGLRGAYSAAFLFHYAYQLFRKNSQQIDTSAGIYADQLRYVTSEDCLIAISFEPYTQLTIDAVKYAHESGMKIIAITDSSISPVAQLADHVLYANKQSPSFYHSFTATVALCQALIALLVAQSGEDAVSIVEQAEKQLSSISAYW